MRLTLYTLKCKVASFSSSFAKERCRVGTGNEFTIKTGQWQESQSHNDDVPPVCIRSWKLAHAFNNLSMY